MTTFYKIHRDAFDEIRAQAPEALKPDLEKLDQAGFVPALANYNNVKILAQGTAKLAVAATLAFALATGGDYLYQNLEHQDNPHNRPEVTQVLKNPNIVSSLFGVLATGAGAMFAMAGSAVLLRKKELDDTVKRSGADKTIALTLQMGNDSSF